jgi:hypothetical protein
MYACCKYEDINLGLFVMEQMLHDNRPDFRSFKRLFDACASAVDLRLWVAYDVMMWFYPLKGFGQNSLKTTAFITELMHTLGLRASSRAGRGFVTLPNPRGEPYDPFASMFEDDDPNYDLALEGGEDAKLRRQLIAEEFEDRNRMKEIVARVKARERGVWNESGHLEGLEAGGWGREAVLALLSETERDETARLAMRTAQKEKEAQLEAAPRMTIKEAWRLARKKQ